VKAQSAGRGGKAALGNMICWWRHLANVLYWIYVEIELRRDFNWCIPSPQTRNRYTRACLSREELV